MSKFMTMLALSALTTILPSGNANAAVPLPVHATTGASRTDPSDVIIARVNAYATNDYDIILLRGDSTVLIGKGDGTTDLDLTVYDPDGRIVAWDYRLGDEMEAAFVPLKTGHYRVEIRNLGSVYNDFALAVW